MKLPKKLTALLACLAMLVVGFTGMVPERAAASTMLDTRVFGDNYGDPTQPDNHFHYGSAITAPVELLARFLIDRVRPAANRTQVKPTSTPQRPAQSDR